MSPKRLCSSTLTILSHPPAPLPTNTQAWCRHVAGRRLKRQQHASVVLSVRAQVLAAALSRRRAVLRRSQLQGAWSRLQLNAEWEGRRGVHEQAAAEAASTVLQAQVWRHGPPSVGSGE
jgi:hypothetical protein